MPLYGQLPVLAALRKEIDERKLGDGPRSNLRQWYWCNVFMERYSSATLQGVGSRLHRATSTSAVASNIVLTHDGHGTLVAFLALHRQQRFQIADVAAVLLDCLLGQRNETGMRCRSGCTMPGYHA